MSLNHREAQREKTREIHRGADLARRVLVEQQTNDVLLIAERVGVRIIFSRWPLVTVGEYDSRRANITVNLAALERAQTETQARHLASVIVAHELGHHFDLLLPRNSRFDLDAERVAHSFAATLLQLALSFEEYEKLWRV